MDRRGLGLGMWEACLAHMLLVGGEANMVLAVVLDWVLSAGALMGLGEEL